MIASAVTVQNRSSDYVRLAAGVLRPVAPTGQRAAAGRKLSPITVKQFNVAPNGDPPPLTLWGDDD